MTDHNNESDSERLKPCPFCASKGTQGFTRDMRGLECNNCFASGPDPEFSSLSWYNRPVEDKLRTQLSEAQDKLTAAQSAIKALQGEDCTCESGNVCPYHYTKGLEDKLAEAVEALVTIAGVSKDKYGYSISCEDHSEKAKQALQKIGGTNEQVTD